MVVQKTVFQPFGSHYLRHSPLTLVVSSFPVETNSVTPLDQTICPLAFAVHDLALTKFDVPNALQYFLLRIQSLYDPQIPDSLLEKNLNTSPLPNRLHGLYFLLSLVQCLSLLLVMSRRTAIIRQTGKNIQLVYYVMSF